MKKYIVSFIFLCSLLFANFEQYNTAAFESYRAIVSQDHTRSDIRSFIEIFNYSYIGLDARRDLLALDKKAVESFISKKDKKAAIYLYSLNSNNQLKSHLVDDTLKAINQKILQILTPHLNSIDLIYLEEDSPVSDDYDVVLALKLNLFSDVEKGLGEFTELNFSYSIHFPSLYGIAPLKTIYVNKTYKDSFLVSQMESDVLKQLAPNYCWTDASRIFDYLWGKDVGSFVEGYYNQQKDDEFAIRLLSLSRWDWIRSNLIVDDNMEGAVLAGVTYPFSKELTSKIYSYAKTQSEWDDMLSNLTYMWLTGATGVGYLLNDLMADTELIDTYQKLAPIIYLAIKHGDEEALEYLLEYERQIEEDYPDSIDEEFQWLLRHAVTLLEVKFGENP
jgi:hypothetical protein